ncbi:MAG: cytochrome c3 family protein [Gemmatimonadales bacterium]
MGISRARWLVCLVGLAWPLAAVAQEAENSCTACHGVLGDERLSGPVEQMAADIHSEKGFSCVACHGGDATDAGLSAMDPARGFIGVPEGRQIIEVCGHCHSDAQFMKQYNPSVRVDQVTEYYTSVHGQRLRQQNDPRVATCADCHPAHSIMPPSNPKSSVSPLNVVETCGRCHADAEYMEPYAIPTDQKEKYERSIHWEKMSVEGDLSAPTCNDCHGNHGAAPPGIGWVGNVCGQCHAVIADRFAGSFHSGVLARLGRPGCATCHGNHEIVAVSDTLLGVGQGTVCGMCHVESDPGGDVATSMRTYIDSLTAQYEAADSILESAEQAGMEVSQAQFSLNDARTSLISARNAVHGFAADTVRKEVDAGLEITSAAYERGVQAMKDLRFRRTGLTVSVVIIIALIVGLVLKIRQVERRPRATTQS